MYMSMPGLLREPVNSEACSAFFGVFGFSRLRRFAGKSEILVDFKISKLRRVLFGSHRFLNLT